MPPRKPTSKDGTKERETDDPTTLILTYLRAQTRPYSATEISSNLHNKVTKTKTDKLLKEMYERKEIMGKTVGKASIYWGLQVRMCVCVCVWRVKLGRMKE
jgi:26S proteasome regulatory subunit (ATPase 3-interacting protein)